MPALWPTRADDPKRHSWGLGSASEAHCPAPLVPGVFSGGSTERLNSRRPSSLRLALMVGGAGQGRKHPAMATSSWLIDGSEMLDQVAPLSRSERAPFVWRYFFVIRSRLAISAAAVITSY